MPSADANIEAMIETAGIDSGSTQRLAISTQSSSSFPRSLKQVSGLLGQDHVDGQVNRCKTMTPSAMSWFCIGRASMILN